MSAEPVPNFDQIYDTACVLAMQGFKLIRVTPRSKVPYDKGWPELATNSAAKIDEWFAAGGDFNLGLACGEQPNGLNIVAIDIDPKNGGLDTWRHYVEEFGKIGGPRHETPSGGFHLPLIFPPGFRNSRNMLGPGIDTRGEGGQILLPPSVLVDHSTGELLRYGAKPGRGLTALAPIHAPESLVAALTAPTSVAVERSRERHPSRLEESPLDFLRRTLDPVETLVGRYGWQIHSVRGDDTYLTRPLKPTRDGASAVVHASGAIVVFTTTDVAHLIQRPTSDGTGIKMSLAEFVAAEETGGDLSALSRQVRQVMPPPPGETPNPHPATDGAGEASADALAEDASWFTFMDLGGILDGTVVLEPPSILLRTDGVGLFYPGVINGIHGESGLGKGWVAVTTVAEVVRAGGKAIYIDLEDTPQSIGTRLRNVGLTKDEINQRVGYIRPTDPTNPAVITRLVMAISTFGADLVVIDSLGEAFGLDGVSENNDDEVAPWLRKIPRAIADTGACVLLVDHVTKAVENPLYAKGSARKRAAIGGASYHVEATQPLTRGRGGRIRLTCAKDRYGFHQRGQVAAEITFSPSGDDLRPTVRPGAGANDDGRTGQDRQDEKVAQCAVDMLKVAKRKRAAFTKTALVDATADYRAEIKRAAFEMLIEQRHLYEVAKGKYEVSAS